jgi:hypothetical protein
LNQFSKILQTFKSAKPAEIILGENLSIPNENQKIFTVNDSARPDSVMIRNELLSKGVEKPNDEEKSAREYLLGAVRKRDEALAKIEEILDNHSFGYDVDAPTVVEADLIREILATLKEG